MPERPFQRALHSRTLDHFQHGVFFQRRQITGNMFIQFMPEFAQIHAQTFKDHAPHVFMGHGQQNMFKSQAFVAAAAHVHYRQSKRLHEGTAHQLSSSIVQRSGKPASLARFSTSRTRNSAISRG